MVSDIIRYNDACGGMEHAPEGQGEYVKYEDHVAVVEGLKKEIEDAREEGRIAALASEGVYERRDFYW